MNWTDERLSRLYELYQVHIEALRRDVIEANRSLGAPNPTCKLPHLTRTEFETHLKGLAHDPQALDLWLRRIVRGTEHEFPELQAAG